MKPFLPASCSGRAADTSRLARLRPGCLNGVRAADLWLSSVVVRDSDGSWDRLGKTSDYPPFKSGVRYCRLEDSPFVRDCRFEIRDGRSPSRGPGALSGALKNLSCNLFAVSQFYHP